MDYQKKVFILEQGISLFFPFNEQPSTKMKKKMAVKRYVHIYYFHEWIPHSLMIIIYPYIYKLFKIDCKKLPTVPMYTKMWPVSRNLILLWLSCSILCSTITCFNFFVCSMIGFANISDKANCSVCSRPITVCLWHSQEQYLPRLSKK